MEWFGHRERIQTLEIQVWSWRLVIENLKREWKWSLAFGLFYGLGFGLLVGVYVNWVKCLFLIFFLGLIGTLIGAWIPHVFIGFKRGFIDQSRLGFKINLLLHISGPYQRFWATFRSSFERVLKMSLAILFVVLVILLVCVGAKKLFCEEMIARVLNMWSGFLTFCLSFLCLILEASQFLRHFSLRLVLYLEKKLPLRIVTFLDRMTDQHIFEDNRRTEKGKKMRGATWRFRHKILQDYFAGMAAK